MVKINSNSFSNLNRILKSHRFGHIYSLNLNTNLDEIPDVLWSLKYKSLALNIPNVSTIYSCDDNNGKFENVLPKLNTLEIKKLNPKLCFDISLNIDKLSIYDSDNKSIFNFKLFPLLKHLSFVNIFIPSQLSLPNIETIHISYNEYRTACSDKNVDSVICDNTIHDINYNNRYDRCDMCDNCDNGIRYNIISPFTYNSLSKLNKLTKLVLSGVQADDNIFSKFNKNHQNLTHLDLSYNNLTKIGKIKDIFIKLERINLCHNKIYNIDNLTSITTLKSINIIDNNISILPDDFDRILSLETIKYIGNPLKFVPLTLTKYIMDNSITWKNMRNMYHEGIILSDIFSKYDYVTLSEMMKLQFIRNRLVKYNNPQNQHFYIDLFNNKFKCYLQKEYREKILLLYLHLEDKLPKEIFEIVFKILYNIWIHDKIKLFDNLNK